MSFILGKKLGMTQIFGDDGAVVPVTLIDADPNTVIQIKDSDRDGYSAVQLGFGSVKKITKAQKGHFKDLGSFQYVREFRTVDEPSFGVGDKIEVTAFKVGDRVRVSGVSKGKGFQGAVKRHGFKGMPRSHGHRAVQRHVGSIGQRFPQHTLRGMRMAGHMGAVQRTTRNLQVVSVDSEKNLIAVRGAVPGNIGGLLKIETTALTSREE